MQSGPTCWLSSWVVNSCDLGNSIWAVHAWSTRFKNLSKFRPFWWVYRDITFISKLQLGIIFKTRSKSSKLDEICSIFLDTAFFFFLFVNCDILVNIKYFWYQQCRPVLKIEVLSVCFGFGLSFFFFFVTNLAYILDIENIGYNQTMERDVWLLTSHVSDSFSFF